ncbi:Blue-light-activated protein [Pelagimonas phthalicica]|uniref:histidine kinase n=1 Tax=Pelagimonas phthalicica TaxID=1037362 RepID=A0A238JBR8_9RHOB|nr:ATP-binding protein [Pelagimonas phthalicica]TDS90992.1 signal transduction histidine kinase [Pelagimonas phthalicica]SMX28039.1 Blue-light-activated protein [Pelagimonas phthalicica]
MNDEPIMANDATARLIKMYRADFGNRSELILRLFALLVAVPIFVFVAKDWTLAIWLLAYFAQQSLLFYILNPRRRNSPTMRLRHARLAYSLGAVIFHAGLVYMVTSADHIVFVAGCISVVASALYVLNRENPTKDFLWIDTAGFLVVILAILYRIWPGIPNLSSQVLLVVLTSLGLFLLVRAQHMELERQQARRHAERRYAQAQKARALNQFVGGVAHDFNNQITAIMGNLELVELLEDREERAAAMRQCRIAADRAALTVQQLVASSGRTRLSPVDTNCNSFLKDLGPVLTDLLNPEITLEILPAATPLWAKVDRDMLETCLIQLCLNAQDAMQGKGHIEIGVKKVDTLPHGLEAKPETAPPYVSIYVQDAGPGVSDETLNKLPEPFYTTKGVGAGTGLGLSAVSGFAKQSGGALVLDNALPTGLLVTLLLPRVAGE